MRRSRAMSCAASVVALALLAAASALAAQTPAPQVPSPLTLDAALGLAAKYNPDYRTALAAVDQAGTDVRAAYGGFLPSLSAGIGTRGAWSKQLSGTDFFGQPIPSDSLRVDRSSSTSQSLSASVPLFEGGRRFSEVAAARSGRDAAQAAAAAALATAQAQVKTAYYQALYDRALASLQERLLASSRERLDATQRLLGVGSRSPADVLGARVDVAQSEQALAEAQGRVDKDRQALAQAMGVGGAASFELPADDSLPVFDPDSLDADGLVARTLEANPALLSANASERAAESQVSAARSSRWPQISASAGYSRGTFASDYGALFDPGALNRGFSFGLSVSIPLFDAFQTSSRIAQARAIATRAHEQTRARRLDVEGRTRQTLIDLRNQYRAVRLAETSAELSRQRVEMAQEQYQTGGIGFTELQQVIDQAAAAERSALAARFGFADALVRLEQLVAGEVR